MVVTTLVVFGYRLTRRPVTVVKFHNCDISMLCKAYQSHGAGWSGVGWGGVGGVGWDKNVIVVAFSCTCMHMSCYAAVHSQALAHLRHATLSHGL